MTAAPPNDAGSTILQGRPALLGGEVPNLTAAAAAAVPATALASPAAAPVSRASADPVTDTALPASLPRGESYLRGTDQAPAAAVGTGGVARGSTTAPAATASTAASATAAAAAAGAGAVARGSTTAAPAPATTYGHISSNNSMHAPPGAAPNRLHYQSPLRHVHYSFKVRECCRGSQVRRGSLGGAETGGWVEATDPANVQIMRGKAEEVGPRDEVQFGGVGGQGIGGVGGEREGGGDGPRAERALKLGCMCVPKGSARVPRV